MLHNRQLKYALKPNHTEQAQRSIFGAIRVYNRLPQYVVDKVTVSSFQTALTNIIKMKSLLHAEWMTFLSPRCILSGGL